MSELERGAELGCWVVGRLLAAGACGKVYEVSNGQALAGFACVVKVIPLATGKGKELKERQAIVNSLNHENTIYQGACLQFKYKARLPRDYFGDDAHHKVRYMVMERLDRDLVSLAKGKPKPTTKQIAEIGLQILDGLKFLHELGFLFVDVKPDNFMLKDDGKSLRFVDFGCVERWLSYNGSGPREHAAGRGPVGTPNYVSLSMQKGLTPTRVDDVECMCYVLLSLAVECNLPWHSTKSLEDVYARKEKTNMDQVCAAANLQEVATIIKLCRAAASNSVPDYDQFTRLLEQLATKKGAAAVAGGGSAAAAAAAGGGSSKKAAAPEEEDAVKPSPPKRTKAAPKSQVAAASGSHVYLTVLHKPPVSLALPVASSSRAAHWTVGREPEEPSERHLVVPSSSDEYISEKHLAVRAVASRKATGGVEVAIENLSRNGAKVDGVKIGNGWVGVELGSVIKIGRSTELRFDAEPAPVAVPAGAKAGGGSKAGGKVSGNGKSKGSPTAEAEDTTAPQKRPRK